MHLFSLLRRTSVIGRRRKRRGERERERRGKEGMTERSTVRQRRGRGLGRVHGRELINQPHNKAYLLYTLSLNYNENRCAVFMAIS